MSQPATFPIYAVKSMQGEHCGHCHRDQTRAEHCAEQKARRSRGRRFSVIRYDLLDVPAGVVDADYTAEIPVSHFECPLVTKS